MNIAFNINSLGLYGLGNTLSSLIRNCSSVNQLKFWFLCAYLTKHEKDKIIKHLKSEGFSGVYNFIDFDPISIFGKFRSLHGDWTVYGRLLLPEIIQEDSVLYLDSDLIIETDVLAISNFNFEKFSLAAVESGVLRTALENRFYINMLGLSPDLSSFNSGVLLFNLKEWRSKNIKQDWMRIAESYPMELLSADQSLLNAVFAGNFAKLPPEFNCPWYAQESKPSVSKKMIIHFVGSPKPWDPLGFIIHRGYNTWKKYLHPNWRSNSFPITYLELKRVWAIRRSYAKVIREKIRGVIKFTTYN